MSYGSAWPPELTSLTWYLYERQSRPEQVKKHKRSILHRRRLRDILMDRGVPEANIVELGERPSIFDATRTSRQPP
jgi:hypothetical protein